MISKNKSIHEFNDPKFIAHLGFLTDISDQLMTTNLKLQQKGQLIYIYLPILKSFKKTFNSSKKNLFYFLVIKQLAECITQLQKKLKKHFQNFHLPKQKMTFLMQPFSVKAKDAPRELQMELIDLQCSNFINKFNKMPLIDFYQKCVPSQQRLKLK